MSFDPKLLEQEIAPRVGTAPKAKLLSELIRPKPGDPSELLCKRFLCRGGGLLLIGPTGVGKSSLSMQAMILWALGREAFGIKPARPLKSLLIQAENDEGDLAEMRDGVLAGLKLTDEEINAAMKNIVVAREDERAGLRFFQESVRPLLETHRPDLLWIDPALSYLGGESNSQKDVGAFLRQWLNPLLREFECAAVVVHHTNKPGGGKSRSDLETSYLAGGSAEWANWPRCTLALRPLRNGRCAFFELTAGKRAPRLGWTAEDNYSLVYSKIIAHSGNPDLINWREAEYVEEGELTHDQKKQIVLKHVPPTEAVSKDELRLKCQRSGIAKREINGLMDEMVASGSLHLWFQKRSGTNDKKLLSRFPQTK